MAKGRMIRKSHNLKSSAVWRLQPPRHHHHQQNPQPKDEHTSRIWLPPSPLPPTTATKTISVFGSCIFSLATVNTMPGISRLDSDHWNVAAGQHLGFSGLAIVWEKGQQPALITQARQLKQIFFCGIAMAKTTPTPDLVDDYHYAAMLHVPLPKMRHDPDDPPPDRRSHARRIDKSGQGPKRAITRAHPLRVQPGIHCCTFLHQTGYCSC